MKKALICAALIMLGLTSFSVAEDFKDQENLSYAINTISA